MYGSLFGNVNQTKNTHYLLLLIGEEASDISDVVDGTVDVKHLFPYWILERSESSSPNNYLVNFVQSYYDWLYTKSGYELSTTSLHSVGLRKILDIENTPVEFLKHFSFTYASGFSNWFIGATAGPEGTDTTENVRSLIGGIRQNLYQQKSNEEAYKYFFQSLFGSDGSDISLSYPKMNIMRLNGGRFGDWESVTGLGGSLLNSSAKLQDSDWYQDFSYLLKAGVDIVDEDTGLPVYYNDLQTMLHPSGLKGFFEKTVQDYIPSDDYDGGILQGENPILGNYFAYRLSNTTGYTACIGCCGSGWGYDGPTAYIGATLGTFGGASGGWTQGNVWASIGSGGVSAEYNIPTHNWPDWDDDISSGLTFGGIYIRDFVYLYPADSSPNLGMTGCTLSGGEASGQCWV